MANMDKLPNFTKLADYMAEGLKNLMLSVWPARKESEIKGVAYPEADLGSHSTSQ